MWSFFSRDTSKDFPYEIIENVAGERLKMRKIPQSISSLINFSNIFNVFTNHTTH